jgi:hypothetical protein
LSSTFFSASHRFKDPLAIRTSLIPPRTKSRLMSTDFSTSRAEGGWGRAEKTCCPPDVSCQNHDNTTHARLSRPLSTMVFLSLSETLLTSWFHRRLDSCYDSICPFRLGASAHQYMLRRLSSRAECGCERQFLSSCILPRQPTECGCRWCGGRPLKTASVMDFAV